MLPSSVKIRRQNMAYADTAQRPREKENIMSV